MALRLISMACDRYNKYPAHYRNTSLWKVIKVKPLRVKYSTWRDVQEDWGLIPLSGSDVSGWSDDANGLTDPVLTASLKLDVRQGDTDVDLASAITL
jgi:hypothetical protein